MLNDPYRDDLLKHSLSEEEYKLVDEVWDFLRIFRKRFVFITDYRNYLIKHLSDKYTPEKFLKLESILNKMFWNLRWLLFPLWTKPDITKASYLQFLISKYEDFDALPYSLLLCNSTKLANTDRDTLKKSLRSYYQGNTFYRSFINKLIMVDKKNKKLITKSMEGSSNIFSKNHFNIMTSQIMWSRSLYEAVITDPFRVKRTAVVDEPHFYYQFDYGFPNMNYCVYKIGDDSERLNRIKKMYYSDAPRKDRFWFKLLI